MDGFRLSECAHFYEQPTVLGPSGRLQPHGAAWADGTSHALGCGWTTPLTSLRKWKYPLGIVKIAIAAIENDHVYWNFPIDILVIFHSYVKLQECNLIDFAVSNSNWSEMLDEDCVESTNQSGLACADVTLSLETANICCACGPTAVSSVCHGVGNPGYAPNVERISIQGLGKPSFAVVMIIPLHTRLWRMLLEQPTWGYPILFQFQWSRNNAATNLTLAIIGLDLSPVFYMFPCP